MKKMIKSLFIICMIAFCVNSGNNSGIALSIQNVEVFTKKRLIKGNEYKEDFSLNISCELVNNTNDVIKTTHLGVNYNRFLVVTPSNDTLETGIKARLSGGYPVQINPGETKVWEYDFKPARYNYIFEKNGNGTYKLIWEFHHKKVTSPIILTKSGDENYILE